MILYRIGGYQLHPGKLTFLGVWCDVFKKTDPFKTWESTGLVLRIKKWICNVCFFSNLSSFLFGKLIYLGLSSPKFFTGTSTSKNLRLLCSSRSFSRVFPSHWMVSSPVPSNQLINQFPWQAWRWSRLWRRFLWQGGVYNKLGGCRAWGGFGDGLVSIEQVTLPETNIAHEHPLSW